MKNRSILKNVRAIPAFFEPFAAATHHKFLESNTILIKTLPPEYEIYTYWNPDSANWHSRYFDEKISPLIVLNQDSLIPYFLNGKAWSIVPYSTDENLKKQGLNIYHLLDSPSDRLFYYLVQGHEKDGAAPKQHL